MKIAHIWPYFSLRLGSEKQLTKQHELGHEICLITSDRYLPFSDFSETLGSIMKERIVGCGSGLVNGLLVYRLPCLLEFDGLILIRGVRKALSIFRPDIVHSHGIFSMAPLLPLFYKNSLKFRFFCEPISGEFSIKPMKRVLFEIFKKITMPYIRKNVDRFFACSREACAWLSKELGIEYNKIAFVPLGADKDLFRKDIIEREKIRHYLNIQNDGILIIYAGKILPSKEVDVLLRSAALLMRARKHKTIKILLLGNGPRKYIDSLRNLANKYGIAKNLRWHDLVKKEELPSFYSAADIGVWPGSPSITIIEAMSTTLPIIIAKSEWTSHLLEYHNGLSFDRGNPKELAMSLERLVENEELRRDMGLRCRRLVEEKLNLNVIAKETVETYKNSLVE